MKHFIALAGAMLVATPALAEDWDFMLTNGSGKSIKTIELAPTGTTDFKPQTVDTEMRRDPVIKVGAKTTVRFDKAEKQCRYDLKATFEDGTSIVWAGANICENSYITLKLTNGKPSLTAS
ncbi:hypothetical protein OK349_10990 [Sphingomonas sp. BT-65]|uniref:hypothetical protein n=1 Tax=Sphingomonas sp. BT-65 TaxID=2989821 RepID=UPI0022355BAB|nr:hypothetical protein [Sphingomonas sp. BT-65]MCW4462232.1 hypothetical protein [Sphingomonas sp. BT-65]